jgi:hypothetical protein
MINFEKFLPKLKSNDNFVIEETIDEIGIIQAAEPVGEVRELLLQYCKHKDPYIRRVALRATAMHWSFPEAFEILAYMLTGGESDDEVLDVACSSIGCYAGNKKITDNKINELYILALENNNLSEEYRKQIYLDFLKYHNLIDMKGYISANINNSVSFFIDMNLVYEKIKEGRNCSKRITRKFSKIRIIG